MPQNESLKMPKETNAMINPTTLSEVQDRRMNHHDRRQDTRILRRPFPMLWGLLSLLLLTAFAVVTQIQFNRLNSEKIYNARVETYNEAVKVYDGALKANQDCITSIETRETYRTIFAGISSLFRKVGDLPVELFPQSEPAKQYQQALADGVNEFITMPVEENLKPKKLSDCPPAPTEVPLKPTR